MQNKVAENRTEFYDMKSVLEENETPKKFWRTAFGENKVAKEFFLSPLYFRQSCIGILSCPERRFAMGEFMCFLCRFMEMNFVPLLSLCRRLSVQSG